MSIVVAVQVGPLYDILITIFWINCNCKLFGIRFGDVVDARLERQVIFKRCWRRAHFKPIVIVVPYLGDLDITEAVGVGIGHRIVGVRHFDCARGGLIAVECAVRIFYGYLFVVFPCGCVERGGRKCVVSGQSTFYDFIGRIGWEVEETQIVALLQVDGNRRSAGGIVEAGPGTVIHFLVNSVVGNNHVNIPVIPDGEPYPVIGIEIFRNRRGCWRFGVFDRDCEREGLVGIGVLSVYGFRNVQLRAAFIDSRQSDRLFIDVVRLPVDCD